MTWRVGIDVGGTFTDIFALNLATGEARTGKVLTTKPDRTGGVLNAIESAGLSVPEILQIFHGTTTATNALLERDFADAAMITTTGFRDTIEIGRQLRERMYDPYQVKPKPYIRRRYRFTTDERTDVSGAIIRPVNEPHIEQILQEILRAGIKSVAICFLNSHLNGANERRVAEIIRSRTPELLLALSHETVPVFREHARFSTTAIRAVTMPIMSAYFHKVEEALRERGFAGRLMILKSNGGLAGIQHASDHPEHVIESGPAGGVAYASFLERELGFGKILHTDMGGTSFDASIVEGGRGLTTRAYELEFQTPVCVPMLEIRSVGAGGGSIGWIDEAGALRVGPQSAGSDPGPACYGRGGTRPTITDANAVLGRLDPELGSKFRLDVPAARTALAPLASSLAMSMEDIAEGMIRISTEQMAGAVKMVLVERGRDQRDFIMASFGGAGPMHACEVAGALNITKIVVPTYAGVASAFGATVMEVRHDLEAFFYSPVRTADVTVLNREYEALTDRVAKLMANDEISPSGFRTLRTAQMRYVGQTNEIEVDIPAGALGPDKLPQIIAAFHAAHEREFGVSSSEFEPSFVSLAVAGIAPLPSARVRDNVGQPAAVTPPTSRPVYFGGRWQDAQIRVGEELQLGEQVVGPAVVQFQHACCVLPPGYQAAVDQHKNLIIEERQAVNEGARDEALLTAV